MRNINKLLCLIMLAFTLPAQAQTGRSAASKNAQWQRYNLGNGSFSVMLPGKPTEERKSAPPTLGVSADAYIYAVPAEKGAYVAQYILLGAAAEKWTESSREAYYSGVWNGLSGGFNKQMEQRNRDERIVLIEKRKTRFSGHDGYEVTFTLGELKGRVMMTLVGRHAFAAMALGPSTMSDIDRERFFKSFTITLDTPRPVTE